MIETDVEIIDQVQDDQTLADETLTKSEYLELRDLFSLIQTEGEEAQSPVDSPTVDHGIDSNSWRVAAECKNYPDIDFLNFDHRHDTAEAFAICDSCPVQNQCLAFALNNELQTGYSYGVWGGTTPNTREKMLRVLDGREGLHSYLGYLGVKTVGSTAIE